MSNIAGAPGVSPGVFSTVSTQTKGASVPGNNLRVLSIIGEGSRSEVILSAAQGGGLDGFNPTFTSATGSDGRHFTLTLAPLVPNRTSLFKNGILLRGLEALLDNNSFSSLYDYRVDVATGRIELQTAKFVDQGGAFYSVAPTNVGSGVIQNLTLGNINAPPETWTIKCISVQRNNLNLPIATTARFVAFGSVSGNLLDANGNPIVWVANNQVATNGTLSFSILETGIPLREGDFFTIKISSGVLNKNDSLTASYIAVTDINDPTFFTSLTDLSAKHGSSSLDNTLTLGSFLAFQNNTPGVMAVQAAPAMPRRTSYALGTNFPAASTNVQDFVLPLPLGVGPDPTSQIHVFVTNPATGVEKQLLPNKYTFNTLGTSGNPTVSQFVFDNNIAPTGNSFAYSVIQQNATLNFPQDGYINRNLLSQTNATFSSASVAFNAGYVGKTITIIDSVNLTNIGSFAITGASNGALQITANATPPFSDFINEASMTFNLLNPVTGLVVASGVNGSVVATPNTATGAFTSVSVNFTSFIGITNLKIQITSSVNPTNIGLFDITANPSTNTVTIAKSFISESNIKFEIIDASQVSNYIVLNHNVVPNGNSLRVTIVDIRDSSFFDAGWVKALSSLETQEIDILVPLPKSTISVVIQNALNHCIAMSGTKNRKERVLFTGAINGLTPDQLTGAKLAAVEDIGILEGIQGATVSDVLSGNTEDLANYSVVAGFGGTFRSVYFFPDQIVAQVGTQNQILSGYYIGAAAGGLTSSISNVAVPLTRKTVSGFSILKNRQFNEVVMEKIAAAGITILTPVAGGGKIVWGKTTTQSGFAEEQEISIVFIRDRIAKNMRSGYDGFIGNPEDNDTLGTLTARGIALLTSFLSQKLITDWKNMNVKRDSVDPRQWNISVDVQPTYPINWIWCTISVGIVGP